MCPIFVSKVTEIWALKTIIYYWLFIGFPASSSGSAHAFRPSPELDRPTCYAFAGIHVSLGHLSREACSRVSGQGLPANSSPIPLLLVYCLRVQPLPCGNYVFLPLTFGPDSRKSSAGSSQRPFDQRQSYQCWVRQTIPCHGLGLSQLLGLMVSPLEFRRVVMEIFRTSTSQNVKGNWTPSSCRGQRGPSVCALSYLSWNIT